MDRGLGGQSWLRGHPNQRLLSRSNGQQFFVLMTVGSGSLYVIGENDGFCHSQAETRWSACGSTPDIPPWPYLPSDFADHRMVSFVGRPAPLEELDAHLARIAHWGFNCLRLLTTWEAVEHAGLGLYDEEYLDYFAEVCRRIGAGRGCVCGNRHGCRVRKRSAITQVAISQETLEPRQKFRFKIHMLHFPLRNEETAPPSHSIIGWKFAERERSIDSR